MTQYNKYNRMISIRNNEKKIQNKIRKHRRTRNTIRETNTRLRRDTSKKQPRPRTSYRFLCAIVVYANILSLSVAAKTPNAHRENRFYHATETVFPMNFNNEHSNGAWRWPPVRSFHSFVWLASLLHAPLLSVWRDLWFQDREN